jgi:hypothetical protein
MDTPAKKGHHLIVIAVLLFMVALIWFFYAPNNFVTPYLKSQWLTWFGVEWYLDSEWRYLPIFSIASFGPALPVGYLAYKFASSFYYRNFASIHESNLKELDKAKLSLQQGIASIVTIEREYKNKLELYERVQIQLQELQAVKDIDTEDLRKKLNAIASASKFSSWAQRTFGFLAGIISSLLASYIWQVMNSL